MPTEEKKVAKPKAKTKAKTTKKTTTKKATTKKAAPKKTTKKTTTKKATTKKVSSSSPKKIVTNPAGITVVPKKDDTDNLLDMLAVNNTDNVNQPKKEEKAKPKPAKKSTTTKTTKKQGGKTPAKKTTNKPAVKVAPKPKHRTKLQTKEEKQLYKRLSDSFNYVANLTMVIEERTMDKEQITDLTLGEIHVLEVVNKELEIPMTKVANQLKITVGSLTTCVNRLVKKEYLNRVRDDVDHRVIKVSTTPKAKKVLKMHDAFHEEILLSVLDGITLKDATKVMEQFERTLENYINPKEKNYESPISTPKKKK